MLQRPPSLARRHGGANGGSGGSNGGGAAGAPSATPAAPAGGGGGGGAPQHPHRGKRVVVVGGGWGGFGAALALAKAGAEVTLLDAAETPGGLSSAFVTPGGRVVEPGIKGFWRCYSNIQALLGSELAGRMPAGGPLTPYTRSGFWSPDGLEVEAPEFGDLPRLPAPLGPLLHTAGLFRRLPAADRLSALGLVGPLLEYDADDDTYARYDATSAYSLFKEAGVSRRLYTAFLEPMLLVTLFAPPTELSAAAALGALYYFALAHQDDWDVAWCRGPVGQLIMAPFAEHLQDMGVRILGGRRAQQVLAAPGSSLPGAVVAATAAGAETHEADAVVLAAGVTAMQRLVAASPVLAAADDLRAVSALRCADVMAARVWLDRKLPLQFKSNVLSGFDAGSGATLFDLTALQDQYAGEGGSVLEFDVYHAEALLPLSDEELLERLLGSYLPPALPPGAGGGGGLRRLVVDASVLRFRGATTVFSPGSSGALPPISTSLPNVFCAGDCVAQGPGAHGARGLSQEKAYASGLQAGNSAARLLGLTPRVVVLPAEPDEPHIAAAKAAARGKAAAKRALRGRLPLAGGAWR
ncbi:MAG: hypothetical protein J3K34DRAFT_523548 [Monoraphidium minutum]|nr:MAG: hypothetical protein J3K34DRAFT_523548 [Monoraphidium minutum]